MMIYQVEMKKAVLWIANIGGSKGAVRRGRAQLGPFFHFHAGFEKNNQNSSFATHIFGVGAPSPEKSWIRH